jgi:fatty-acid O-methyltransferase
MRRWMNPTQQITTTLIMTFLGVWRTYVARDANRPRLSSRGKMTNSRRHGEWHASAPRPTEVWDRALRSFWWKFNTAVLQKPFYSYVTRRLDDDVLFMNWAYEQDPPMDLPLDPADESHRYPIQLYHCTATQSGGLTGKQVLEVGCGRGGGASYLTRALGPASYVGLDLNAAGIRFCRRRHQLPGLEFVVGHAENLPFPQGSFDAVINIESSHCYPHFDRFLSEVTRVLRPGGMFLYADIRQWFQCDEWEAALAGAKGLRVVSRREINAEVLRGMELNSANWAAAWDRVMPRFLRPVTAAPVEGTLLYRDVQSGKQSYRMYCLAKA